MADKKIKLEALTDNPPELAPAIAKKLNETAVADGTKKKLLSMMGKPETDAKLLKETAAADAAADLKKFKEKVLDKPSEIVAVEAIRADVHDKILAALGGEFTAGADKYKIEDLDAIKAKFKKPDAPAPAATPAAPAGGPQVAPSIATADESVYTARQIAKTGLVAGGLLTAGSLIAGTSQAVAGASTLPWYTRGISGFMNFWKGAWDIGWHKGVGNIVTNGIWNPLNTFAAKLGVTTGAGANTAALAGLPAWMAPVGLGAAVVGGASAGSRAVNWLGKKIGVEPTTIPLIGKIPVLGPILNSFLTVPAKAAWKGGSWVAGKGWSGVKSVFGAGQAAVEKRGDIARFGLGALAGATILAPLTGGASLIWGALGGHVARKGLKGKHFTDFVPAPFGVKKSAEGAAAH